MNEHSTLPFCMSRIHFIKTYVLMLVTIFTVSTASVSADNQTGQNTKSNTTQTKKSPDSKKKKSQKWISLFNGKNLDGWKVPQFGGEGEVHVKNGNLILEMGVDLTGVTITDTKKLPLINYEVELEAMRVDGNDFFCGLTFPVKKDPCSLILGGWGGSLCGLSSIDGDDASQNSTTSFQTFKKKQWYKIRLQVTDHKIQAWLDGKRIIDQNLKDRKISIRHEVELSKPFGITSFSTTAALKNIKIRKLTKQEIDKTAPRK